MSVDQILAILRDKGEIAWSDGAYRLKVNKIDGLDLFGFELQTFEKGKVASTLTAKKGRITVGKDPKIIVLFYDEGTLVKKDFEADLFNQDFELPAPRTGKRR